MSSAAAAPLSLSSRLLVLAGCGGLGALTLAERSSTRMYAMPWTLLLVAVVLVPPLLLLLRLASASASFRFPAGAWAWLAAAAVVVPLASALASSYRPGSLLLAGLPASAACAFLLAVDWLGDDVTRRVQLERFLFAGAGLVTAASTAYWLRDVVVKVQNGQLAEDFFAMRNPHPLGHSNYTAGLMLLALPWLTRAVWRNHGTGRVVAAALTALALLNLFTSGSRGGLLGAAALGLAGLVAAGRGWKRNVFVGAGLLALVGGLALVNPRIRALIRTEDSAAAPNPSNVQRAAMLKGGWLMGCDRPLLGWGPGTTPLAYPRYRHALDGGAENVLQLHNTPLQFWAETGAAGLVAAILLCGMMALNWQRSPAAATTLAGYGVFALTDYQLDVPVFAAAIALLTALLASPAAPSALLRIRVLLGLAILIVTGVIGVLGERDRTPALNAEALQLAREPAQHDRAVALLNESLALNPDQEIAHFNLGWLLLVPAPAKAEQHFLAAARLVPDKGGVYFGLGLARLNQGRRSDAAYAFALECVNDPHFLASPWWTVPEIAEQREATASAFRQMLTVEIRAPQTSNPWVEKQAALLLTLAPRLGQVSSGPENNYRRERIGYPVLMRNQDIAAPVDLYDVREDPRFPASVPFPLPSKGWLPSPRLLKLLNDPVS